ncbi:MAG: tRNA preQ1(34) S-adenosylmethionine ribosyltransferase-isomerase QueA [Oscillospiraceae bacterium]|jgi:S-adenosylmethionine:tRNA ribosyltransferase-isomerase|nr:tRNA preQ1(34) S-adenosylmethionine ribosyltransferase-isomerase QueA [Oscillospiraceae bacterium]
MKKSDFFYDLPQELIAQTPADPRDSSRLLVLHKADSSMEHRHFYDITEYLNPGDCLVLNDTKVLPARLYGVKEPTGACVEFLLLHTNESDIWECLAGPGKKALPGAVFIFGEGLLRGEVLEVLANGNRRVKFSYDGIFYEILDKIGEMPLPHYITETLRDKGRYQTVYAKELGSAAAPTAGLHFTPELLGRIREKGVDVATVTLHVGIGTFRPVKAENIEDHEMHSEFYSIGAQSAAKINAAKRNGGRVIAVGTTSCRTLESAADERGQVMPGSAWTNIFIYPGYRFRCVDALITNFHLPESSLVMLVSAFCSLEQTKRAYEAAVKERYRFFSFGDAMFVK